MPATSPLSRLICTRRAFLASATTLLIETHLGLAAGTPGFLSIAASPAKLDNGSPFLLTVVPAAKVVQLKGTWMGKGLSFFKAASPRGDSWYALAGVDVDVSPGTYPLSVEATSSEGRPMQATIQIAIGAASYRSVTLTVAPNFVEPDAATKKEIAEDKEVKDRVFAHSAQAPLWSGDFAKPVHFPATDSFGTRRTFNGKLASVHRGMDFRAPAGTPVAAANSGAVVIAQKLFYEGNCVCIDHGLGFWTIYMHFSKIEVVAGQRVSKGERLGLSGATGRVTGPHLHFAVRWLDAYLDPAGLFGLKLADMP